MVLVVWINFGLFGVGVVVLLNFVKVLFVVGEVFKGFVFIFWGFGFWWFIMVILMMFYYFRNLYFFYSFVWWGFIFFFGVYVSVIYNVGMSFGIGVMVDFGFVFYWFFLVLWLVMGVKMFFYDFFL